MATHLDVYENPELWTSERNGISHERPNEAILAPGQTGQFSLGVLEDLALISGPGIDHPRKLHGLVSPRILIHTGVAYNQHVDVTVHATVTASG